MARSHTLRLLAVLVLAGLGGPLPAEGPLFNWNGVTKPAEGPDLLEPLVTDRPDFTEASSTVGLGVLQLETGYTFVQNDDFGVRTDTHSVGEFLVRYGIVDDWLEFRMVLNPLAQRTAAGGGANTTAGTEDLVLGTKIWLTAQEEWRPEMSVITALGIPTGSNAFSANEVQPGLNWLYSWDLSENFSLAGSTGFTRATDEADHDFVEISHSWAFGASLTDDIGAYVEWFAFFPHSALAAEPQHYVDGGFTFLVSKDVQFDIRAGKGLNSAADDFFAGVGLSVRWP